MEGLRQAGHSLTSEEAGPGVTLLGFPDPYHRGVAQRSPGQVPSSGAPCPYPTVCHLWVAHPLRVVRSPVAFLVATPRWPPAAALPVWTFLFGAVPREDRHHSALKVVFCPQALAGHFGRLVGTATPLRGHRRPGPVRASAHLSQVLVGAGVTPAVHSHGPAPLAPVVAVDRRCAHGRVNSDRAEGRPCSRLIRPQGPHPRTAAWRACPLRSHAVGCCWFSDTQWTASSTAGRFRRLEDSGEDHPAGKYVPNSRSPSGRPHPVPLARLCAAVLSTNVLTLRHLGCGCRPRSPYTTLSA